MSVAVELQPAVAKKTLNEITTDARRAVAGARIVPLANRGSVFLFGNIILKLPFRGRSSRRRKSTGTLLDRCAAVKIRMADMLEYFADAAASRDG